jgi:hypothetical protein
MLGVFIQHLIAIITYYTKNTYKKTPLFKNPFLICHPFTHEKKNTTKKKKKNSSPALPLSSAAPAVVL